VRLPSLLLVLILLPALAYADQLDDAKVAHKHGNNRAAALLVQPLADRGNAEAQDYLGMMHEVGWGFSPDGVEAMKWYRKSAEQGNADAQFRIGQMYEFGERGIKQDYPEAFKWYGKAADQGNADALYNIGRMHELGRGVKEDLAEAIKWWRKAAEHGNTQARDMIDKLDGNPPASSFIKK